MAGYNHAAGMSNNAVTAYEGGYKPLSKIKAADLRRAGVSMTLSFARWLAQTGHWQPAEWHHSGGEWYNRVNFYDPCDLAELDADEVARLKALYQATPSTNKPGRRVKGTFAEWGGSRRHPKIIDHVEFTGTKRGDWIHLDDGGKKRPVAIT